MGSQQAKLAMEQCVFLLPLSFASILRSSYVKTFLGDARVKEVMDVAESGYQCQQVCIASITNLLFVIDYTEK